MKRTPLIHLVTPLLFCGVCFQTAVAQNPEKKFSPIVPKIYDDAETATWQVPLALAKVSPSFLTSSYFYARKVHPIYRTYPVYHPDREPAGYRTS